LHGSLLEVVRLVGFPRVPPDHIERLVAVVTGVSLGKTAGAAALAATTAAACYSVVGRRWNVAGIVRAVSGCSCLTVFWELGRRARTTWRTFAEARAATTCMALRRRLADWVDRARYTAGLSL
jgi:hypothetical protein